MTVEAPTQTLAWTTAKNFEGLLKAWVEGARRCLLEGGTAASKTWGSLQFLIVLAEQAIDPLLISVVSETLPHLKRGCIRDFFAILEESPDNNPHWSKTEFIYKRPDWKGEIEFFGADNAAKVRGPRRDILFINEGNNISWEAARGLDIRTARFTVVDWNPVSEFWAHENWKDKDGNAYIHSTYQDAREVLPAQVVTDIEAYKDTDPNWWNIYGLGMLGKVTGLVYPNFQQVDTLPKGDKFYGLDFGFLVDPTVLIENVAIGDKLYSREVFYEYGELTNDAIARKMDRAGVLTNYDEIYADPSEPKSIEEIHQKGFNIKESEKGPGSVEYGQQKVNQSKQYWTKDSINCIKEQRNHRFIADKDGNLTSKTTHRWSHGMDARRYGVAGHRLSSGKAPNISVRDW